MRFGAFPIYAIGVVAGLLAAAAAHAQDSRLRGQFALVGTSGCLISPTGFNGSNQPNDPTQAFYTSFNVQGITTFHGNGTADFQQSNVSVTTPPPNQSFPASASSTTVSGSQTYHVGPQNRVTVVSTNIAGTVDSGPRAGQTFTIDQTQTSGRLTPDNRTLVLADAEPFVETQTFSNGTVNPRICHGERILVRLTP